VGNLASEHCYHLSKLQEASKALFNLTSIDDLHLFLRDFFFQTFNSNVILVDFLLVNFQESFAKDHPELVDMLIETKSNRRTIQRQIGSQFFHGVPLINQEKVIGSFIIYRSTSLFSDVESITLESYGPLLSIALTNLHNLAITDKQQRRLNLVHKVTEELVSISDLDQLTKVVTDLIMTTFNYYYVAIFTKDPSEDFLTFQASAKSAGIETPHFEYTYGENIKIGDHIVGHVANTGELLVSNDVYSEPHYGYLDSLAKTRSEIALPLVIGDQTIGVLDIQSESIDAFSPNDIMLLQTLADNIAIAIQRIDLYKSIKVRADQISAISDISLALTSILNIEQLLEKVAVLIQEYFSYPFVHIYLSQPDKDLVIYTSGVGERASFYKQANIAYDINSKQGIIAWVAREKQIKCINDVRKDEFFISNPFSSELSGSELALPLIFADTVMGVLDIQSPEINAFSENDTSILRTLAANIAISIRNAKLYRSEIWRRQVAESLRDVALKISGSMEINEILSAILEEISPILKSHAAAIWLANDQRDQNNGIEPIEFSLVSLKLSNNYVETSHPDLIATSDAWFWQSNYDEMPIIRKPGARTDPLAKFLDFPDTYSGIAAPLIAAGKFLGLLTLHHSETDKFGSESQNITSSFAGFAAISIENSRLLSDSQKQAWISTVLLQAANATQSLETIPELVSTVVRLTPLLAGIEGCGIILREGESDLFLLHAIHGSVFVDVHITQPLAVNDSKVLINMINEPAPIIVTDPSEELGLPLSISELLVGKTIVLLPLITHSNLLGAFLVVKDQPFLNHDDNILSDENMMIIQGVAQLTATATENIHLSDARQEEAYVSTILLQVAQEVVSRNDLSEILESIVHLLPLIVGVETCVIYTIDLDSKKVLLSHYYSNYRPSILTDANEDIKYDLFDFPIIDEMVASKKPILHPLSTTMNPDDWDLIIPIENSYSIEESLNVKSGLLISIPLVVNNLVVGALLTHEPSFNPNRKRRFELINGIAQQATLAIQNDLYSKNQIANERLNREFQLAREIQRTFLPDSLPQIGGYECDVMWQTARQVGGDFYDIFKVDETHYGLVIADVSDKGLAASLYMAVTRTLLRGVALENNSTARSLEKLNDLMLNNSQRGLFVTIFYAVLNIENGLLKYTNAGHNHPYLIQFQNKQVIELKQSGIAIGALPEIHLQDNELSMNEGDYLILHTDGVTETFDPKGSMFGENRYKKLLQRNIGLSTYDLLKLVDQQLNEFRNSSILGDDTTLLAIRRQINLAQ
jgi:serine phosphatase RsbU (regulator of sigma subunit)/putative methionine-R-sulfoxide reductase with GAF domain